jgi:AcrR family transcriptional regulator
MAARRDEQRERMRSRLLDAALALFEKQGYERTTIDQIAERADVARQTVLNHYPQKHDFIEGWGARRRALLLVSGSAAESDAEVAADPDPLAMLRVAFERLAEVNMRERALGRAIREQMIVPQPVPDEFTRAAERAHHLGMLRADASPRTVAEVLAGLYYDTMQRWLVVDEPPFDLADELRARLDLVIGGLAQR